VVRSDGQKQTGASVQSDGLLDLALVRVTGAAATPLPLGDVSELVVGEQVMVIGSPMGLEFTVHPGIVSNVSRTMFGLSYFQIDAQVNPGNSGGPVLNDRGQVVGVVSLKHMGAEGIGLALPVNYAWSGQNPLLPAPARAVSTAFAGRQAQADEQNRELRQAVAAEEALPALLGGYVDSYRRLVVRIGRLATRPPDFEIFTLKLMRGPEELCSMQGDVSEWKEISGTPNLDPRLKSWMEGNQLDRRKYVGDAPIRIDQCPPQRSLVGLELVLVGGHPQVSRVAIR
jgi:serine protease Do